MSDLIILTQPRACRPPDGEFLHSANFAWLVRGLVDSAYYSDLLESDTVLESLELFGDDTWKVLEASGLFKPSALAAVRDQMIFPDGTMCFYPVARLRPSDAPPLVHPTTYSAQELSYTTNQLLTALAANRFKLTRAARQHMGDGEVPGMIVPGRVSSLELLQMELSDTSALLGWGWVWYQV
jgi:hypothetical protein